MSIFSWLYSKPQTKGILGSGKQFTEAENRQSEVIDVALHQLKTPLVALKWSIKMLLDKTLGPLTIEQESILLQDYSSCDRAIATIEGILKADRIEKNNLILHILNTDITILIQNKIIELKRTAELRKITLKFSTDNNPILSRVPVDADRISDVLQNLINNALTYTPEGGIVSIKAEHFGNEIRVSVSDSGMGIPKDHQKNIFMKFYRAPNGAKMDPNGTGLGLFIAKNIIEKHNGKIWFESTEGKGTTFYFTLPASRS